MGAHSWQGCIISGPDKKCPVLSADSKAQLCTTQARPHPTDASITPAGLGGAHTGGCARIPNLADALQAQEAGSTLLPALFTWLSETACWQATRNMRAREDTFKSPCTCRHHIAQRRCSHRSLPQWRRWPAVRGLEQPSQLTQLQCASWALSLQSSGNYAHARAVRAPDGSLQLEKNGFSTVNQPSMLCSD